jgi:hypothetical protein
MDRRHFFQILLSTPLITPLLLASQSRESDREIYLISDTPQTHLPPLLKELNKGGAGLPQSFAFARAHPKEASIKTALVKIGWIFAHQPAGTDLEVSFFYLDQPTFPSFSLVKDGKIWDVRSWNLRSLWNDMGQKQNLASLLTVASLNKKILGKGAGELAVVYMDGRKRDVFSLKKNARRSYASRGGQVTIQAANGYARVLSSSCRHKVCLHSPPISLSGERIICAPNHFLIEIQGGSIDAVIG